MRIVIGIPARLASTRFPRKLLAPLAGIPVLAHTIHRAQAAALGPVVVATDADEIAELARRAGARVCMTRADHPNGTSRLAEAFAREACDLVVNVQGDEPLVPPAALRAVARALMEDEEAEMATLAAPIAEEREFRDPHVVKVVLDRHGHALYFSRAPIPYGSPHLALRHLGIYAYRHAFLMRYPSLSPSPLEQAERLEQLRVLHAGVRIRVVTGAFESVGIDTPEDLARAQARMRSGWDEKTGPQGRDGDAGEAEERDGPAHGKEERAAGYGETVWGESARSHTRSRR